MLRPVRDARVIPVLMSIAMMVVGLVNFLTGMIALLGFQHAQLLVTEYSHYLKVVSSSAVSDVLTIFIGLVVIGLGMGLYHRYRVAWRLAFFQCIAIANNLYGAFVL